MTFAGMDIEAALRHARTLETDAADGLFRVLTTMEGIVPRLMEIWQGADAEAFRREWDAHRQTLVSVHGELSNTAQSVSRAIQQQHETSA